MFLDSVYEPMFLTYNVTGRILLERRKFTDLAAKGVMCYLLCVVRDDLEANSCF